MSRAESTSQTGRYSLGLVQATVRTGRMPMDDEDQTGIWRPRYYRLGLTRCSGHQNLVEGGPRDGEIKPGR